MAEIFAGRDRQDSSLAGGFQMSSAVHGPINVDGLWIELALSLYHVCFCGFSMEIIFAVKGIELCVGFPSPKSSGKYLEGSSAYT